MSDVRTQMAIGFNEPEKDMIAALYCLIEHHHLEYVSDRPPRIKVKPRHLVRTMDGQIVLAGARGRSLEEALAKLPGFTSVEIEQHGHTLTRISASADGYDEESTQDLAGRPSTRPTAVNMLAGVQSQAEWYQSLAWEPYGQGGNPIAQNEHTKFFSTGLLHNHPSPDHAHRAYYLRARGTGWRKESSLFRRQEHGWEVANLATLEDERRGKFLMCELNGVVPMAWDGVGLILPAYLNPPQDVLIAITAASMTFPTTVEVVLGDRLRKDARRYSCIDETLMRYVANCLWVGGDIDG